MAAARRTRQNAQFARLVHKGREAGPAGRDSHDPETVMAVWAAGLITDSEFSSIMAEVTAERILAKHAERDSLDAAIADAIELIDAALGASDG